jgi:hypothetical protein
MYNNDLLDEARQHIKIIHENTDGRDEDFKRANTLLNNAEQIVFLGFGYNPINLERLQINAISKGKHVIGTCVDLGAAEQAEVRVNCPDLSLLDNVDCYEMVKERMQWR